MKFGDKRFPLEINVNEQDFRAISGSGICGFSQVFIAGNPLYPVEICNSVYFTTASHFSFLHRKRAQRVGKGNLPSKFWKSETEDMTTSFWQSEHQQMS